jgi:dienelactone hydrolase
MRRLALACLLCVVASTARSQSEHQDLFYSSGTLRIQAYLYRPSGDGPFPAVIYNHGTRDGRERVPERRGYGKSNGEIWWREVGNDQASVIRRLQAETDDVLAGADYLRTLPHVDPKRLALMGWSFGGVVTMLATARGPAFLAAVNQAGGALTWDANPHMRNALMATAEKSTTPTLLMVAKNDRTTSSVTTLADIFKKRNTPHTLMIYEPFSPPQPTRAAPGHALFSVQGTDLWEKDVIEFLGRYLG